MNVKLAMRMDRLLGYPLSLCVWFFARVLDRVPEKGRALGTTPERILIIKPFGFGSILEMYPMIHALRQAYPKARLVLFTFQQNRDLARLLPIVDEVRAIPFGGGLVGFGVATLRMLVRLRSFRADVILDCEFYSFYCSLLTFFSAHRETVSVGFTRNQPMQEWVFHHTVAVDLSRHISEIFHRVVEPLGIREAPVQLDALHLVPPREAQEKVDQMLENGGEGSLRVAVNINASPMCLNRRWPLEYYRDLLELLLEDTTLPAPAQVYLIGGPDDIEYVSPFEQRLKHERIQNVAGQLAIAETAALLQQMDLFIGNDSGPLHLALACGVPTISFFGPETPALYGPLGDAHTVFYEPPPCSPCLNIFFSKNNKCDNNVCLKRITAGMVYPSVRAKLPNAREVSP